jgi:hypothetical protein
MKMRKRVKGTKAEIAEIALTVLNSLKARFRNRLDSGRPNDQQRRDELARFRLGRITGRAAGWGNAWRGAAVRSDQPSAAPHFINAPAFVGDYRATSVR